MNSDSRLNKYILLAMFFGLVAVTASLLWNIFDDTKEQKKIALESARSFFNQIVLERLWNAQHGGVYVPITENTQPNLYLDDPLREVITTGGLTLTKVNPAFMTRQISEIAAKTNGVQFHLTSLKPVRPANKPADWEASWLRSFERGVDEQSAFVKQEGQTLFRYMAPLYVKKGCLKCHAKQGYKVEEIRGGISVTLPFIEQKTSRSLLLSHAIALFLGLLGIFIAGRLLDKSSKSLVKSNIKLEESLQKAYKLTDELQKKHNDLEKTHKKLQNTQAQLLQQEKMASIGQLAAGVAHEINNPIGFISSNLSTLEKYVGKFIEFIKTQTEVLISLNAENQVHEDKKRLKLDFIVKDAKDLLSESLDGAQRVSGIVQNLKTFSRVDEAVSKEVDINECLETTIKVIWNELKHKAKVIKEYGELPLVKCSPQELNQVFMNLIINASHAIEGQGEIAVRTWRDGDNLFVSISDTGKGIPDENINKLFEPFFTTKEVGKGTGLGLSISHEIIQKHEGEINVESEVGKGTTFTIRLPVSRET